MKNTNVKLILEACKALKDKHFFTEAFDELEAFQKSAEFDKLENIDKCKVVRLLTECKYQDKELSSKVRFKSAENLLNSIKNIDIKSKKQNPEWSCLMGAIYKRKYQLNKHIDDLFSAIKYYNNAIKDIDKTEDDGYGAVNSIFLYKTLLHEYRDALSKYDIQRYEKYIRLIRKNALEHLDAIYENGNKKDVWIDRTYAELYFSNEKYDKAKSYLIDDKDDTNLNEKALRIYQPKNKNTKEARKRALKINTSITRDKLITIEQIIRLYKLQTNDSKQEEMGFLKDFFENFVDTKKVKYIVQNILIGKLGLALSGGGFRASLFHLGVFARLAELDMLRHVDMISAVSGGSIVAMHYYLKLQDLLQTEANYDIEKEKYIELVQDLQKEFLKGIQTNIRMQAFQQFNPCNETATQRLGKLYQKELYDKATNSCTPRAMNKLYIYPKLNDKRVKNFNPHFNNVELRSKVPILVINSTCLNNGHNWRFTASGMGESQYMYDTTIDKNRVHNYTRYSEFGDNFKHISIADAVASSSCVPGLFDPIELDGAYKDGEVIKLIDGGVYDNQGLASLLDEDCKLIICSDASGQFSDEEDPSSCRLSIIPRVNNALMDRGRDAEYEIVKGLLEDKKIDGLCILHLKQCFKVEECTPTCGCNEKDSSDNKCQKSGIYDDELDIEIQKLLSKVRTDLDSFNNMESYALMYSGYVMMSKWFEAIKEEQVVWKQFEGNSFGKWKFLDIKSVMRDDKDRLKEQLVKSEKLFFKFMDFKMIFRYIILLSIVIILLILIVVYFKIIALLSAIGIAIAIFTCRLKCNSYTVVKLITKPIVWMIAKFNLKFLNDKYIEYGRLKNESK